MSIVSYVCINRSLKEEEEEFVVCAFLMMSTANHCRSSARPCLQFVSLYNWKDLDWKDSLVTSESTVNKQVEEIFRYFTRNNSFSCFK